MAFRLFYITKILLACRSERNYELLSNDVHSMIEALLSTLSAHLKQNVSKDYFQCALRLIRARFMIEQAVIRYDYIHRAFEGLKSIVCSKEKLNDYVLEGPYK